MPQLALHSATVRLECEHAIIISDLHQFSKTATHTHSRTMDATMHLTDSPRHSPSRTDPIHLQTLSKMEDVCFHRLLQFRHFQQLNHSPTPQKKNQRLIHNILKLKKER